jgi:hypothetical protein
MHERLTPLILRLAGSLESHIESCEHPGPVVRAAQASYDEAEGLAMYERAPPEWSHLLASILGGCEYACKAWATSPEYACEVKLREELRRLRPLVVLAEAAKQAELCGTE